MVVVSVIYPATPGTHFDLDYYLGKHAPLVDQHWGPHLTDTAYLHGTADLAGGPPTTHMIALLTFASDAALRLAVGAHGKEIMGDIKNFTDTRPVVQLNTRRKQAGSP